MPRIPSLLVALILVSFFSSCSSEIEEDPLAFCEKFIEITSPEAPLNNFDFDDPESVSLAVADLTSLTSIPPDSIAEQARTVVNLYKAILETLVSVSPNDRPSALQKFQSDIDQASSSIEALAAYGTNDCGIIFTEDNLVPVAPIPLDLNN
ncbi:MAG TPA: hypothetical protein QF776_02185 [Acidimicrobiales bacterium]|nr:hypothetical protein [Acidimicrobiales bacterium]HJM96965.1 hypothetical protein [Acidimicrobiales bacterium]